jgi:hypothetical protein
MIRSMSALRRLAVALACLLVPAAFAPAAALGAPLRFSEPIFVDEQLAGGEPVMLTDPIHHTIVYSSHEGTTHLYRPGLASATTFGFLQGYRNQVKMWTSKDGGASWQRVDLLGSGFTQNPVQNTGFSDPDLSQDDGGRIYNTGINLASDALFSSGDGGLTWDKGTAQCHAGDRPWIAAAHAEEAFFVTNTLEDGISARVFQSTDGGETCSTDGVPVFGEAEGGGSFVGNGKMLYDRTRDALVMPANVDGGLGVATWYRSDGFSPDVPFKGYKAVDTSFYAHWSMIALDDAGGLYLAYDPDPEQEGTEGGCNGGPTPAPNSINVVYSPDLGKTWGAPFVVARPSNARVLWPWIVAGDRGRVNVVWYETDKIADLACQPAELRIMSATVTGADTPAPRVEVVDAAGRPIANNNICQSGTTCVATGEDRRLGDFFTNAIDERGCVMIASGDTSTKDPISGTERNIALPIFMRQTSGPALRGGGDCSGERAGLGLENAGGTGGGGADGGSGSGGRASSGTTLAADGVPLARKCVSRRNFRIRLRHPAGDPLRRAKVFVNGKRVRVVRGKRRLRARVDLRGLPKGRFLVKIQAVTRAGKRLVEQRAYRTCTPKPKKRKKSRRRGGRG